MGYRTDSAGLYVSLCFPLLRELTEDSLYEEDRYFEFPISHRLAFREFGTCLGIGCHDKGQEWSERKEKILASWRGHLEEIPRQLEAITQVMYATALIPGGKASFYLFADFELFEKDILEAVDNFV